MNAQLIKAKTAPVTARGAAVGAYPVALAGTDGKVIISTLPRVFAAGADLFAGLLPADRELFATGGSHTISNKFFFDSPEGGVLLLTSLADSCGAILAVVIGAPISDSFARAAKEYGFERLICRAATEDPVENRQQTVSALGFALRLDQLFSESDSSILATKRSAEEFLEKFTSPAGVGLTVERTVQNKKLFDTVDYKAIGLASLILCAISASFLGKAPVAVSFSETVDRHSIRAEFSVGVSPENASDLPSAESLEALLSGILAFKCKNLHVQYVGCELRLSFCPEIFDPDAEGLMQGNGISRTSNMKGQRQ